MFGNGVDLNKESKDSTEEIEQDSNTDETDDIILENSVDQQLSQLDIEALITLPTHLRCTAHLLNLIASNDLKNAAKFSIPKACKTLLRSTMAKCTALWNLSQKNVQASEIVKNYTDRTFIIACITRWSSLYDSLTLLKSITAATLDSICDD